MEQLKNLGNDEFKNGNYQNALNYYNKAIELDTENHILYSNRCAVYLKLENKKCSLKDAITCTKMSPSWSKGWSRLGDALLLNNYKDKALVAFRKSLELNSNNSYVENKISELSNKNDDDTEEESDTENNYNIKDDLPNMPGLFNKILNNPNITKKMKDTDFQEKFLKNKSNPVELMKDPEVQEVVNEMWKNMFN